MRYQSAVQMQRSRSAHAGGGISETAVCQRCDRTDDRPSSPISPAPAPAAQRAPKRTRSRPRAAKAGSQHKVPPLSIGLLASGGALALAGIGCLAGAWSTSQQVGNTDLTFAEGSALSVAGTR